MAKIFATPHRAATPVRPDASAVCYARETTYWQAWGNTYLKRTEIFAYDPTGIATKRFSSLEEAARFAADRSRQLRGIRNERRDR
jgi:hypothetical protein